jgi:tight adherence protein B
VRRLFLPGALGIAAALALLPAAAGAGSGKGSLELTEAGGAKFPNRAFVVSLPRLRQLTADQVQVTEDGKAVADVAFQPTSAAAGTRFGTVVIVDSSDSMAGKPIVAAMAAARAFEARRNQNEQLAFITFNGTTSVVLPFTKSKAKIDSALLPIPKVAYGTHIYDAVSAAENLLSEARIDAGSIVLLSDGADTGSKAAGSTVTQAARASHVKLFTIGLKDRHFDPKSLTALAAQTGGEYALAKTTNDLFPLFQAISSKLANEYLLTYKSLASADGQRVAVAVNIPGSGSGSAGYQAPTIAFVPPKPYHASLQNRILGSWITIIIVALIGALGAGLLVFALAKPQRSGLPQRMSEFVSIPGLQSRERRPTDSAAGAETEGPPPGLLTRIDNALEIAQINTTAIRLITLTIVGTVLAFIVVDVITNSLWWALLALLVPLASREFVVFKLKRRRKQFAEQLPDMLQVIAGALRAGQSFAGALAVVVDSAADPMKAEMQRVVADEQLGVPISLAMKVVVKRMKNRDLEQVALVAELQRETGGNSAEVVDRVAETVRERFDLRRLIDNLTVQGRMSRWIVSALPVALVLLIRIINPQYLHPLTVHTAGKVLIVIAVLMVIAGSYAIKKIVEIEV